MSNEHTEDVDADPWASAEHDGAAPQEGLSAGLDAGGGHEPIVGEADFTGEEPEEAHYVDAPTREVQRKKSIVPKLLIIGIAAGVIGVTGSGLFSLYRKFVPAAQQPAVQEAEAALERPEEAQVAKAQSAAMEAMAAGGKSAAAAGASQDGASTTIGATPQPGAPAASVADPASAPVSASAATEHAAAPAPVVPAAPPVAAAAPAAPSASSMTKQPDDRSLAGIKPAVAAVEKVSPSAGAAAVPSKDSSPTRNEVPAKHARRAPAPKHEHTVSDASRAPAEDKALKSASKYQASRVTSVTVAKPGQAKSKVAEEIEQALSVVLSGYRIEAINPKFGKYQVAWVRTKDGRLRVVSEGDSLDGARVIKIDGASYSVSTNQGEIR